MSDPTLEKQTMAARGLVKFHIRGKHGRSRCGSALLPESDVSPAEVPKELRCQSKACRYEWPENSVMS